MIKAPFSVILRLKWAGLCLLLVMGLWLARPVRAESDIVVIDHSDKAYTVYAGLPANRAVEVRRRLANQPADVLTFDEFAAHTDKYISQKMVRNDYPEQRAVEGIVALVRKYPNTPFGLTWNGGIAFTRNDYQFAKARFELFGKDPETYQPIPLASDPVAPIHHLKPLLGW